MERVVGRSELYSENATPTPSTPDESALERLRNLNNFEIETVQGKIPDSNSAKDEQEDELDFRLFATAPTTSSKTTATTAPQKIRLRSPSIDTANAGFLIPHRNPEYYFAASPSDPDFFTATALSGSDILSLSQRHWPGSAYAWKVLHIPASGTVRDDAHHFRKLVDEARAKRTRPGKKARVKLRVRKEKSAAKAEARRKAEEERELAEREKRTKRNREKKIKRREKERLKKAEAGGGQVEDGGDSGSDDEET